MQLGEWRDDADSSWMRVSYNGRLYLLSVVEDRPGWLRRLLGTPRGRWIAAFGSLSGGRKQMAIDFPSREEAVLRFFEEYRVGDKLLAVLYPKRDP